VVVELESAPLESGKSMDVEMNSLELKIEELTACLESERVVGVKNYFEKQEGYSARVD
jgi:hypothetical protein